jgi:hypothetical protein
MDSVTHVGPSVIRFDRDVNAYYVQGDGDNVWMKTTDFQNGLLERLENLASYTAARGASPWSTRAMARAAASFAFACRPTPTATTTTLLTLPFAPRPTGLSCKKIYTSK